MIKAKDSESGEIYGVGVGVGVGVGRDGSEGDCYDGAIAAIAIGANDESNAYMDLNIGDNSDDFDDGFDAILTDISGSIYPDDANANANADANVNANADVSINRRLTDNDNGDLPDGIETETTPKRKRKRKRKHVHEDKNCCNLVDPNNNDLRRRIIIAMAKNADAVMVRRPLSEAAIAIAPDSPGAETTGKRKRPTTTRVTSTSTSTAGVSSPAKTVSDPNKPNRRKGNSEGEGEGEDATAEDAEDATK